MDAALAKSFANLPSSLAAEMRGDIAMLRLARPQKRNALNDETVLGIEQFFFNLPDTAKAAVIYGEGENFSAGLDLSELTERNLAEGVEHSRMWHRVFERIEFGRVPVVAVLHGAVVGGGLELACACHIRVAEKSAYYALPEGRRGIFVGGGGSVRIPRLIGVARMQDMMLTGRTYNSEEGLQIGLAQYLVKDGEGMTKGMEIAQKICENAPMTNYAVIHALPRIAESSGTNGYVLESLVASIAQNEPEAKARLKAFLEKRAPKVLRD